MGHLPFRLPTVYPLAPPGATVICAAAPAPRIAIRPQIGYNVRERRSSARRGIACRAGGRIGKFRARRGAALPKGAMDVESALARWLDTAFAGFDTAVLGAVNAVQQSPADAVLAPLARLLDLLGTGGWALIALGLALLLARRTRRFGACVLLALALGALCTNVVLKPLTDRARPYADESSVLHRWWQEAGGETESDASFPSGHATAAAAAMAALFFLGRKRRLWPCLLFALAMALSRLYLMVHYPTDVLAGLLIGLAAGWAAAAIVRRWPDWKRRIRNARV